MIETAGFSRLWNLSAVLQRSGDTRGPGGNPGASSVRGFAGSGQAGICCQVFVTVSNALSPVIVMVSVPRPPVPR